MPLVSSEDGFGLQARRDYKGSLDCSVVLTERDDDYKAHLQRTETREENISKPSAVIEALESQWKDPALAEFAQKAKTLIESNSGMLDLFLVESEKAFPIRQSSSNTKYLRTSLSSRSSSRRDIKHY
jgi:hypothetical protein